MDHTYTYSDVLTAVLINLIIEDEIIAEREERAMHEQFMSDMGTLFGIN